jgi:16S rRNA (cytosine967-C5)-methyltransferase
VKAGRSLPTARQLARAVLERVELEGAYANRALSAALDRVPAMAADERALATEIVYGVLRRRGRLGRALGALATSGLDKLEPRARIALYAGAYQILFLDRIPAYAAVNDAVEACKQAGGRGVGGFANALLRRLARDGEPPLPDAAADPAGYLTAIGLPDWLARLLLAELPAAAAVAFGESVGRAAPVTLRANPRRTNRVELAARLTAERPGAVLTPSPIAPDALNARSLAAPAATDAWRDGLFAIADAGAQIVAELCGAEPGERIMDACAGSGGKSAHLLALSGDRARVDAVDVSADKLDAAAESLRRLGLTGGTPVIADLTVPLADQTPRYHRILLDAPCSGLGVLRRHPETLLRRSPADIDALAERQLRMLSVVAPALLPGGLLIYAVCTFDRRECEDVVAAFLRAHPRFSIENAAAHAGGGVPWALLAETSGAVRTWPQRDDADAFYAVRLRLSRGDGAARID